MPELNGSPNAVETLYREVVLEHYRKPRNRRELATPDATALLHNPVCGDQVQVEVLLENGRIREVSARARGCSIVVASGSVMTELVAGLDAESVRESARRLAGLVRGQTDPDAYPDWDRRLRAFARIADVPARERCALLPWEALTEALGSVPS